MASIIKAQGSKAIDASGPPSATAISLLGGTQLVLINDGANPIQFDITDSGDATKTFTAGDFALAVGASLVLEVRNANSIFAICDTALSSTLSYLSIDSKGKRG